MNARLKEELTVATPIGPGKGPGQRLVQEYLNVNGIRIGIDGDWGPATQKALERFNPGAKLVDQALMQRLAQPLLKAIAQPAQNGSLAETIIEVAHRHLEQHPIEVGGQNMGPWVRHYMNGYQGPSWPWCAGFVSTLIEQACAAIGHQVPAHLKRSYSCDFLANAAKKAGKLVRGTDDAVAAGAIFLVRGAKANDWIHTGIIIDVDADTFDTIEGNTNDEGSREGFEVCQRIRGRSALDVILL